jgi:hypothetical protein
MTYDLPTLNDDGLIVEEIGSWGEEKYRLLSLYSQMFAASMKNKWQCRVYIDLFAGSGRSRIKGTNKIIAGSPVVALNVEPRFDRYIFCERSAEKLKALRQGSCGIIHPRMLVFNLAMPTIPSTRSSQRFPSTPRVSRF